MSQQAGKQRQASGCVLIAYYNVIDVLYVIHVFLENRILYAMCLNF